MATRCSEMSDCCSLEAAWLAGQPLPARLLVYKTSGVFRLRQFFLSSFVLTVLGWWHRAAISMPESDAGNLESPVYEVARGHGKD
jgi:hypothetical protein